MLCVWWVWWNAGREGCGCPDTLLGPEGSGVSLFLMANEKARPGFSALCVGWLVGCWLWALPGWWTASRVWGCVPAFGGVLPVC